MLTPTHTHTHTHTTVLLFLFPLVLLHNYLQVSLMLHTLLLQVIPVLTPTLTLPVVVSLTMILLVKSALAGAISCAIP